jgi:hypothetical protein
MAVTNFVPDIWSARILTNLSKTAVVNGVCNRDYEGDTAVGDEVKITSITDPTITAYTGGDMTPEDIDDASRSLLLDQKQSFNFYLDDVEAAQSVNGGAILREAIDRASYGLSNVMDAYALDVMWSNASASNPDHVLDEVTLTTAAGAYNHLVDLGVYLDEADIPPEERFAVVPPAFYALLLKDDRFVGAGDAAGASTRANGLVGEAAGLAIYRSNNLPTAATGTSSTNKGVIVGSRIATTLAEQVRKVEAYRVEKKFADGVKGLHVYGVKVTRPTGLVASDVAIALT